MEKLFATKWWDYSNYRFNINGRVCLLNSVLFGIMGVVAVKFVNPVIMSFVNIFNDFWIKVIGITLMIIFLVDLIFTIKSLVNFKNSNVLNKLRSDYWTKTPANPVVLKYILQL